MHICCSRNISVIIDECVLGLFKSPTLFIIHVTSGASVDEVSDYESVCLCTALFCHLHSFVFKTNYTHTHTHTHTHNLPFCPDNFPLVPDGALPCQNQPPMPGRSLSLLLLSHNYVLQGCEVLPLGFYQLFLLLKERSQHCRMTVCVCVCVCVCARVCACVCVCACV